MVGLGVDFGDVADYVVAQRPRHRGAAAGARAPALPRAARAGVEHGRLRRGPLPLRRRTASSARGRARRRPRRRPLRAACPRCGAPLAPEAIGEDAPPDPRNVYAATKLHQEHLAFAFARETGAPVTALRYHNVYGPRMPRDTPYAGVAAIFAGALAAGRAAAGLRGRRPAARLRPRPRRRARQPRWRCRRPSRRRAPSTCARARRAASARWRARCAPRTATAAPPVEVTGEYRLGDVRHVFASAALAADALGFIAREDFATGMAELADEHRMNPARETASAQRATATLGP